MLLNHILSAKSSSPLSNTKQKIPNNESTKRSFAKTLSWRAIGTLDTILISWFITGTFAFAISIGTIELFTKMILYFFHERIWNSINFGK